MGSNPLGSTKQLHMEKFIEVSQEEFEAYIKENKLTGKREFLHYSMYDEEGRERAKFQHGSCFDMHSILIEENEEVIRLLRGKF